MRKTKIRNQGTAPMGLPYPMRGILPAGHVAVLNAPIAVIRAALGGDSFRGGLELEEVTGSSHEDFWLGDMMNPGPFGPTGPKGDTGAAGAAGASGSPGATGAQGIQGIQGTAGTTGSQGAAGTNGTNGTNGAAGAAGASGPKGDTGPAGLGTPVAPADLAGETAGIAVLFSKRTAFAATGLGGDDVAIWNAAVPFDLRILDVVGILTTGLALATLQLFTATGGGGTALSSSLTALTAGRQRTTDATHAILAGSSVFLRRSTGNLVGEILLVCERT